MLSLKGVVNYKVFFLTIILHSPYLWSHCRTFRVLVEIGTRWWRRIKDHKWIWWPFRACTIKICNMVVI